jgi:6-phosphogluconolactonase (cycloisomerase 2 family)
VANFQLKIDRVIGTKVYFHKFAQIRLINACRLNLEFGHIELVGEATGTEDPSFLAIEKYNRYLYCVNELDASGGKKIGTVSAFSIDKDKASLKLLNIKKTNGTQPAYIAVDKTGSFVSVKWKRLRLSNIA